MGSPPDSFAEGRESVLLRRIARPDRDSSRRFKLSSREIGGPTSRRRSRERYGAT
jgi:hypothetical protein